MIVAHVRGHGGALKLADEHARSHWFGRLDARAKVVGVFGCVIVIALLTRLELVVFALAFAVALAAASRVPSLSLARAYAAALPFVAIASVSIFLFSGTDKGLAMLGRTSACVLLLLVLVQGTKTFDLFGGLRRLRMPAVMATLLMLTYRYIIVVSEEFSRMRVARKARGFGGGRSLLDRYALKILSFTAGMVLVRSTGRADRVYEGLKCRGFTGDMSTWRRSRLTARDCIFLASLIAVSAVLATAQAGVVAW
jgi:cobalt/nickel transport system permease protein